MAKQIRILLIIAAAATGFFTYPTLANMPILAKYKDWLAYGRVGAAALTVWILWKYLRVSAEWIAKQLSGIEPGSLPAPFLRRTWGWIGFQRARKTLQSLRHREHRFSQPLFQGFRASPRPLDNTAGVPGERISRSKLTIVSGPAGAGKSTLLDIIFPKLREAVDLTVLVRHDYIRDALQGDSDAIWRGVVSYFRASLISAAELSDPAIAFAFDRRRVLLVFDDLHLAGRAKQAIEALEKFFASFGGWREDLTVLATTREPITSSELTGLVCTVLPLNQRKAQVFFFDLCCENGVADTQLIAHGDALSRAFGSEPLRVPLFIAICAYLAVPDSGGNGNVPFDRLFDLNRSEVFAAFVEKLGSSPKSVIVVEAL